MAPNNNPSGGIVPSKSLKQFAKDNRSMLGDPTSLKAETSVHEPGESDREFPESIRPVPDSSDGQKQGPRGSSTQKKSKPYKTLKEAAKENITMLGDPVSLKAETSDSEPTPNDRGALSSTPVEDAPQQKRVRPKI